ncbi:MAG: type V CRISPR-associated protein Cas12a/Cpf1 [Prevotellaceae bacterium]|jgi:CRISPR-associated protein Cpf1|nr:type V CRISPR-associated protein Cas12a/Cpf1 [Prevotellaceae bacterium]
MKKQNLTVQEFLELDKKFNLLDFITVSYEPFHLMGNQGILNEIQKWIEQREKFMNNLNQFVNQYQLFKTLRFELIPLGVNGLSLNEKEMKETFKNILEQDRKIKEAYIALKPVLDKIHERVINTSLTSGEARQIDFGDYFEKYKQKKRDLKNMEKVEKVENTLRNKIVETYEIGIQQIKNEAGNDAKGKAILGKKGIKCLMEKGILEYIEKNIDNFVTDDLSKADIQSYLDTFENFFTYFSGFNQNRENYYAKEEKSTAIATRIVHDNLPKFCDNIILFTENKHKKNKTTKKIEVIPNRKDEYLNTYQFLKDNNKITQIKDAQTGKMIEAKPIDESMFKIEKFSECLSQAGIEEYNKIIGHYNLLINLYNQARKEEKDFKKLAPFKILYKQIGCGKKKALFDTIKYDTIEEQNKANDNVENVCNLKDVLKSIGENGKKYFGESNELNINEFIKWLKERDDWDGVYWSKTAVNIISNIYFANWFAIQSKIQEYLQSDDKKGKDIKVKEIKDKLKSVATYDKRRDEQFKLNDAVELSGLFEMLDEINDVNWSKAFFKNSILEEKKSLINENLTPSQNLINLICDDIKNLAKDFCEQTDTILKIDDYKKEDKILDIKKWLDNAISIIRIIKYFSVNESKAKGDTIDPELSSMLSALLYAEDTKWFDDYDSVRNYLTKKPQDDAKKNKLKLNFNKNNLLNGFVDSYSNSDNATQYGGYIFRKKAFYNEKEGRNEYEYFLGISANQKLFRCHLQKNILENDKSDYERLEYYQAKSTTYFDSKYNDNNDKLRSTIYTLLNDFIQDKDDNTKKKILPIINSDTKDETKPSQLFEKIEGEKEFEHILRDNKIQALITQTILDLKDSINKFVARTPALKCIKDTNYKGIDGYKRIIADLQTIAKENRVFDFFKVSQKEFNNSLSNTTKPLYLFKIKNKDLSFIETSQNGARRNRGTENLHTLFFRALMKEYNNCDSVDLGKGEIFFRESAIQITEPTHPANQPILRKKDGERKSKFVYNIIKDKRFTEAKFQLHLSILLNFREIEGIKNGGKVNQQAIDVVNNKIYNTFIQDKGIQFLGIDRGEKHLIYYSLINTNGEIIEQNHLDIINGKDYLKEINDALEVRRKKQENWQQKGNIKNLKDGYMSLVVHEIIEKMKDKTTRQFKPTFIVLEDLNQYFKRLRQKFEQQVYQKFELALAKKLNYLVDKNAKEGEIGTINNALQFTPPVQNYQDIESRKQFGIMLYTRANYTSIIDPETGWRKTIYLKTGNDTDIKKQILENFSDIGVDEHGDYFFKYTNKNTGKIWTLWSSKNGNPLERYRFKRGNSKNASVIQSFNVKKDLDNLFQNFDKHESLLKQLNNGVMLQKVSNDHTAWESLRFAIDLIQHIRNSGDHTKGQDENFLLSPVRNEQGEHFDSRRHQKHENADLPTNGDANGAYNIARKGIIMYEHIKQWIKDNKINKLNLFVCDEEWDLWLSDKSKWNEKLKLFASGEQKDN